MIKINVKFKFLIRRKNILKVLKILKILVILVKKISIIIIDKIFQWRLKIKILIMAMRVKLLLKINYPFNNTKHKLSKLLKIIELL
jgi:hypothetical protein